MNDPNYTTRDQKRNRRISNSQHQQQQQNQHPSSRGDGRRRVATATGSETTKANRPRSGSWGVQELYYYMNNAAGVDNNGDVSRLQQQHPQGKPKSRFLSKLKMQRAAAAATATNTAPASEYMSASSSVMTLAPSNTVNNAVPPSESLSGNNKQKRRPPLPLEMVQPDQTVCSTPHPSLARYDQEKPLPAVIEAPLFAMTPTTNSSSSNATPSASKNHHTINSSSSNNKKRTTIKSIGRFFRALGKNQSLEQQQSSATTTSTTAAYGIDNQLYQQQHLASVTIDPVTATPPFPRRSRSIDSM
ncbi:hypothetical protein BDB00DRAFT_264968 [Zychaea mexicana]|uniref:uncharacterized protein n=1 Tax=Zychaea mexicana TaxID=64656 RepID=UPI0022FF1971|nr:uncharacterized protein BDB00DRAFT_264968 [Zychaea mexicana]KAI9469297.1 hypothetical protein BDB00DRAFT_264968 [Zychaea mexicana]